VKHHIRVYSPAGAKTPIKVWEGEDAHLEFIGIPPTAFQVTEKKGSDVFHTIFPFAGASLRVEEDKVLDSVEM